MMSFHGLYLLMVAAFVTYAVRAEPKTITPLSSSSNPNHHKEIEYQFRYAVDDPQSGVVNSQWEHRVGEYVKGAYSLVEPDGKVRHVDYEVDGPRGFHAVVRTTPPANNLLSYREQEKIRQSSKQPPVNVLTNRPVEITGQRTGRLLPINFHKIKPDYYLAFAKGTPENYRIDPEALEAPDEGPIPANQQDITFAQGSAPAPDIHRVHKHDKEHGDYVLPSVEGITYPRRDNGVARGFSASNIRPYYPGTPGDVHIPHIPSTEILPPTETDSNYAQHTQVIFEPYAEYLGG